MVEGEQAEAWCKEIPDKLPFTCGREDWVQTSSKPQDGKKIRSTPEGKPSSLSTALTPVC